MVTFSQGGGTAHQGVGTSHQGRTSPSHQGVDSLRRHLIRAGASCSSIEEFTPRSENSRKISWN